MPKTRTEWWLKKLKTNKANDAKAIYALQKLGWKVIVIWECLLKTAAIEKTLAELVSKIS